ncbi:hypothetical protein BDZ89DRAFT_1133549 [Hymenopellis radicata]|nr:hypothetical protein BDZ89DRAFT_1133549 [Hymenopellis radicata]
MPELKGARPIPLQDIVVFKTAIIMEGDDDQESGIVPDCTAVWARHINGRVWYNVEPRLTHGDHFEWFSMFRQDPPDGATTVARDDLYRRVHAVMTADECFQDWDGEGFEEARDACESCYLGEYEVVWDEETDSEVEGSDD